TRNASSVSLIRASGTQPDITELTATDAPDADGSTIAIDDPDFIVLGPRRALHVIKDKSAKEKSRKIPSKDSGAFSAGDPYGSDKGMGQASVNSEAILESQGILRDMWNAMLHLKKTYPDAVTSVEWYTPKHGFSNKAEPKLISFEPFTAAELASSNDNYLARNWPYLNPTTRQ